MKCILKSASLALVMLLTMSLPLMVMGQASVDDGYKWCQFIDRPDRPEIDGCKVAYFDHICICE